MDGKVYCAPSHHRYDTIACYDPSQNKWTTLPPLSVQRFGLGQVNGKLVAVGGQKKSDQSQYHSETNEVYTYNERSQKWEQTIPPMPTAGCPVDVLILQSALVVVHMACDDEHWSCRTVEIFKPETSQWYRTDPLILECTVITSCCWQHVLCTRKRLSLTLSRTLQCVCLS